MNLVYENDLNAKKKKKKGKREKKIVRKRCSRHFYFLIKVMETGIYFYCPACTQAFPRSSSRGMMSVRGGGWFGMVGGFGIESFLRPVCTVLAARKS